MAQKHIKTILRVLLIGGSLISLYFVPWILVKAWILPLPATVEAQLDQGIDHGFDGMIVYVDVGGEPEQYYTSGWHNREKKIPAKRDALFKIASISKLYVAVALTKLAHDKRISLDKTLLDYFPELDGKIENAENITLRLMIQHRSGIPNYTNQPEFWADSPESNDHALDYVLGMPASFSPGEDYEYSNTNYLLLRRLMDNVLGNSYHQYVKEEILIPLGLNDTYDTVKEVDMDDVMSGYYVGIEEDFKSEDQGMVATAKDVGVFLRALNDGSVFDTGEQEIYSSIYEYDHTGLVPGYQSIAKYHKDIDAVIIQFNNTTDFNGYEWNLAEIIYGRVLKIVRKDIKKK